MSTERVLLVSDTTLDSAGNIAAVSPMERMAGREGALLLLNGQSNPLLTAQPGARERWRIINTCVGRFLRLRLDGQQLQLLGMDSGRSPEPETVDELLLAPGNRADLLVTAAAGEAVLQALPYDRGGMPGMMGQVPQPRGGRAGHLPGQRRLRSPARRRHIPAGPGGPEDCRPSPHAGSWSCPWAGDRDAWAAGWRHDAVHHQRPRIQRGAHRHDRRGRRPWRNGHWSTPAPWTTPSTCTCGRCS